MEKPGVGAHADSLLTKVEWNHSGQISDHMETQDFSTIAGFSLVRVLCVLKIRSCNEFLEHARVFFMLLLFVLFLGGNSGHSVSKLRRELPPHMLLIVCPSLPLGICAL